MNKKIILLVHGPNLNLLGQRDAAQYGSLTLQQLERHTSNAAAALGYSLMAYQSNSEGALIDWIQAHAPEAVGIIINPGALTHYSYALYDALVDTGLPCVEVHLSDIANRQPWRATSVIAPACIAQIMGKKEHGYAEALAVLHEHLQPTV